jgi:hypothetical protein
MKDISKGMATFKRDKIQEAFSLGMGTLRKGC